MNRIQQIFSLCLLLLVFSHISVAQTSTPAPIDSSLTTAPPVNAAPDTIGAAWEADTPYLEYLDEPEVDDGDWSLTLTNVLLAFIVFSLSYVLLRFVTRLLETLAERRTSWRLTIKAIIPIIRIFSWTVVLYIIIAHIFAPPIQTLVALTASAGIAIGFASQDILKNIFGGVMILFDRPFQVGDKIQVGEHYGEVINIGLRTVRILTPGQSIVSVPNAEVVNQSVVNANMGERDCQVAIDFHLPPHLDFYRVRMIAERAAATSRFVLLGKPIRTSLVNEVAEGRSLVKLGLRAFVFDHRNEFSFRSEVTERVLEALIRQKLVDPVDLVLTSGKSEAVQKKAPAKKTRQKA